MYFGRDANQIFEINYQFVLDSLGFTFKVDYINWTSNFYRYGARRRIRRADKCRNDEKRDASIRRLLFQLRSNIINAYDEKSFIIAFLLYYH